MEEWLHAAGLTQHLAAFREHGLTRDQLPELTDDDLRELGLSIGERVRFRRTLAVTHAETLPPPRPRLGERERRPLTVMFVDIIDSASLGERLDPEDLLELLSRYRALCDHAIAQSGGHVARYLGDGILAYFGYPAARENDPEHAVHAALAITSGIAKLETPAGMPLHVRIGIATGRVVLSDLVGPNVEAQVAAVGSVLNLAARLQTLATADGVVVSEPTHARIRARFVCETLGEVSLRGFTETHRPWRVLRQAGPADAIAPRVNRLTTFRGRRAELSVLDSQWTRATAGDGNVVLVVGEAGIGKSRLIEEFLAEHLSAGTSLIRLGAVELDRDSPLRPMLDHLRARAHLAEAPDDATALARLQSSLAGNAVTRANAARTLAGLFGIALPDPTLGGQTPDQLREATIAVLIEQCLVLARRQPLCFVVEDLHWLDPTSLDLLEALAELLGRERMLLILSTRDEGLPDWASAADAIVLKLRRLAPEHVAAMLKEVLDRGNGVLAREVATRTDGIPLFIEEVARFLVEHRLPASPGDGFGDDLRFAIPASLDELLVAHLDRAGAAKGIAQVAAVIGRSVRRDILAAAAGVPAAELADRIGVLVDAGILLRVHESEPESYSFSHALLRDAAYASLVRDTRRALHARAADALVAVGADIVERQPEQLALHLTEAGRAVIAAPYWLEAGRRSLARSAVPEAARLLSRGLAALAHLPQTQETTDLRVQFSALLGPALLGLHGALAPETQDLYRTAYELCEKLPEDAAHFPIYWGWWRISPDFNAHQERAASLLLRARARNNPELLLQAHHCTWATHLHLGDFDLCCEHMAAGLAIYDQGDYAHHTRLYGNHDAKVCAHGSLSQLRWMQGQTRSALAEEEKSLGWAGHLDHIGTQVHALGLTLLHRVYRRDHARVYAQAERLTALTDQHGLADHAAAAPIFQGWVVANQGDPARGLQMIEDGFARQRDIATSEDFPVYLCLLAEALGKVGKPEQAVERIARELPEFDRIGLRIWIPELKRVLADSMLIADPAAIDRARALLDDAAGMAETQGVAMLGLRIAVSRARLDLDSGNPHAAASRLRQAIAAITEPEETADLAEARRMLQRARV